MSTKSIGILGLGIRTTLFYIEELNRHYYDLKECYTCPLKMINTNFEIINNLLPTTSPELEELVDGYLSELVKLEIATILVPNITLHETVDNIVNDKTITHPVALTIAKLKSQKIKNIVLIGSMYTMEGLYLKNKLNEEGIEVLHPTPNECEFIDEVRRNIYNQTEDDESLKMYNEIIAKYSLKSHILIACTELSIGWDISNGDKVFDMARIQIENAVNTTFA
ncbi:aspartate/glutamate racemase family protein [Flavobacterium algicola]|uniref:aspartate/glutamate racemase family protein n=1 Tax=Flavobacterium algicola TaxID=556529 RepID=UPI001EFC9591|nr:hypothetical protein [Flavobacterium algicola]MCG9793030.1 hypothetical protein [Flavobacterium algicola]